MPHSEPDFAIARPGASSRLSANSPAVGMVVAHLRNPYFVEIVDSLQAALESLGVELLLAVTADAWERQRRLVDSMIDGGIAGLVLVPASDTPSTTLDVSVPLIMLARRVEGVAVDYVGADNRAGAALAARHLVYTHKVRRLAFIGGQKTSSARWERVAGVRSFAEANSTPLIAPARLACSPDRESARKMAHRLLSESVSPDGVVCFNDLVARGVSDAVTDLGLRVGQDVRVVSFDDVGTAADAGPALTSIAVDNVAAGVQVARLMLERIDGRQTPAAAHILPVSLQVRESCGCSTTPD